MTSDIGLRVGRRIRELREAASLSQARFGALLGKTTETISRIENGATLPSLRMLEAVAKHLGVDVADIVSHAPPDDPDAEISRERMLELLELLTQPERRIVGGLIGLLISNRGR
jgi:transcriptional regulator with XRE-family HTH domain